MIIAKAGNIQNCDVLVIPKDDIKWNHKKEDGTLGYCRLRQSQVQCEVIVMLIGDCIW